MEAQTLGDVDVTEDDRDRGKEDFLDQAKWLSGGRSGGPGAAGSFKKVGRKIIENGNFTKI